MPLFPTDRWLEAYGNRLDESETLDDLALSWGPEFDGNVLYVIEENPLEETVIGDLPEEALEGIPENVRAGIGDVTLADAPETFGESVRPTLPDTTRELLEQVENDVVDGTIYAYISLDDGRTEVDLLGGPDERPTDFVLRGPYTTWRRIVDGRPPMSAVLNGNMTVQGDLLQQVRYSPLLNLLGEVAAEVETTHLFEGEPLSLGEQLLDQPVEQSAAIQRTAHRQVSRMFDSL
jgi:putative sterol carrier protein